MTNRLLGTVLMSAVIALVGLMVACGDSLLPDGVVAKVGDTYITADQLDEQVEQEAAAYGITEETYPDDYEDFYESLQGYILENLITNEIADQEAVKLGLSVSDEAVQTEVDSYLVYYNNDQTEFEEALATEGQTLDDFKKQVKDGLLRQKLWDEVVKDAAPATEDEVMAYYEANLSSYYVEPSRQLRHILIKPEPGEDGQITDAAWAAALSTAEEVRGKLVTTGDWTGLAAEYSDDLATKDSGGDLGTVTSGEQIKEFEDAAFALELDDISQPVKTVYGYEIIQATDVTVGGEKTLDEVRDQIEAQLLSQAQNDAWSEWLDQKLAEAGVIYRDDLRPETTTTTESTTTTLDDSTTTT